MPVYTKATASSSNGIAGRLTTARYCPKRTGSDDYRGAFMWYGVQAFPNFDACTYCYNTHIQNSPPLLAQQFVAREDDGPEVLKTCDFHFPSTVQTWYQAANAGNFSIFTDYLQRLDTTAACPATIGSTPLPGLRWMTLTVNRTNPEGPDAVDGFVVCERCYKSIACATPFANRFEPFQRVQGPQEAWSCDLALPSIEHAFSQAAGQTGSRVPWNDILNAIRTRFAVRPCTGPSGSTETRQWWTVRPDDSPNLEAFAVCDEHYHDCIIPSGRSREFVPMHQQLPPGTVIVCDFATHNIQFA